MEEPEARRIATWQAPLEGGRFSEELLLSFNRQRERRVLILPALFDEANKLRRFTWQVMHAADAGGVDTFLPDLPGCNESLVALDSQTLDSWRNTVEAAVQTFAITHVLAIRAGALLAPLTLPGWQYAPLAGPKLLRGLIRARTIASREMGHTESSDELLDHGRQEGLMLGGWQIGASMLCELENAALAQTDAHKVIQQKDLGGAGLWLRAEPGEDNTASEALAAIICGDAGIDG